MLRYLITVLISIAFLFNATSFAQSKLGEFVVEPKKEGEPIQGYGDSPKDVGLIIYSTIKNLEIEVISASIGNVVKKSSYNKKRKAYVLALEPFSDTVPKYTLRLNHPSYMYWEKTLTPDDLDQTGTCIFFEVYGERSRKPEKHDDRRSFGISVGYAAKQFKNGDGTYPWCYIGDQARSSSPAWAAGVYWAPEFRYGLGIQTGCYFDFASCKYADIKLFDCNLSIPARLQYRYVVLDDFSFFIFVGPSFELSLAYDISIGNGKENISLYDAGNLSRFNLLLGCGAGLRWKGLQIMFSSDWGLVNILKDGSGYAKLNKPFGLTLSYNFKL